MLNKHTHPNSLTHTRSLTHRPCTAMADTPVPSITLIRSKVAWGVGKMRILHVTGRDKDFTNEVRISRTFSGLVSNAAPMPPCLGMCVCVCVCVCVLCECMFVCMWYLEREVFRTAHININTSNICLPEGCGKWVWSIWIQYSHQLGCLYCSFRICCALWISVRVVWVGREYKYLPFETQLASSPSHKF